MSRKMLLKNMRSRSHFWLKNLRVQPLFVFWDPGVNMSQVSGEQNWRPWLQSTLYFRLFEMTHIKKLNLEHLFLY